MSEIKRLCMVPKYSGVGGPASFQMRFAVEAARQGVSVCYDLDDHPYDAVLVVGGTRQLWKLLRARHAGIPVIQRLDGFNWLHRQVQVSPGYYLRAEVRNWVLRIIRRFLADKIVYQSQFVVNRWFESFGPVPADYVVIHNGIDLKRFTPDGPHDRPTDRCRIMLVEGSFTGGNDLGLKFGLDMAAELQAVHGLAVEVFIAGRTTPDVQHKWSQYARVPLGWLGVIDREEIPDYHRSAHMYVSSEFHPECPNAVIEALACGLPVCAYDTGALPEMVTPGAGRIVPYGADAWKLEPPDTPALAAAALEIWREQDRFRAGARRRAEEAFDMREVVWRYLEAIESA